MTFPLFTHQMVFIQLIWKFRAATEPKCSSHSSQKLTTRSYSEPPQFTSHTDGAFSYNSHVLILSSKLHAFAFQLASSSEVLMTQLCTKWLQTDNKRCGNTISIRLILRTRYLDCSRNIDFVCSECLCCKLEPVSPSSFVHFILITVETEEKEFQLRDGLIPEVLTHCLSLLFLKWFLFKLVENFISGVKVKQ